MEFFDLKKGFMEDKLKASGSRLSGILETGYPLIFNDFISYAAL
jgi:hypothetical protein